MQTLNLKLQKQLQFYFFILQPVLVGVTVAVSTVVPQAIIDELGVSVSTHNRCRVSPSVVVDWKSSVHSSVIARIARHRRISLGL